MEQYLHIQTTCRICLKQEENLLNLLQHADGDKKLVLQLFINITGLQLNISDKSYKICNSCYTKLESIQEFINSCRQNHSLMLERIEKLSRNENDKETILINSNRFNENYDGIQNYELNGVNDTISMSSSESNNDQNNYKDETCSSTDYEEETQTNYADKLNDANNREKNICLQNEFEKKSNIEKYNVKNDLERKNDIVASNNETIIENVVVIDASNINDDIVVSNYNEDEEIVVSDVESNVIGTNIKDNTEDEVVGSNIENCIDRNNFKKDAFVERKSKTGLPKKRLAQFPQEIVLREIELIRKSSKPNVQCLKCNFVTSRIGNLINHMKFLHKNCLNNWCQKCNLEVENLSVHKNEHKDDIKCTFCNKVLRKKSDLLEHLFGHSDKRTFECEICKRMFCTRSSVMKHKRECDVGKTEIGKNKELNARIPDSALCSICGKEFKTQSKLEVHMRSHSGYAPYKCSHCDKRTSTRSQLVMHERTHTGEKPYVCNICGKAFAQSGVLKTHMRQHTGRPYLCMICDKRFCRPALLKIHMRKHTGEKPYVCSDCGQSFKQQSHLSDHEKTHSDDRPFQCEICLRGFRQKSSLKTHINIHLGEKPFKCKQCPYACRQSYSLTQHMKQHTRS